MVALKLTHYPRCEAAVAVGSDCGSLLLGACGSLLLCDCALDSLAHVREGVNLADVALKYHINGATLAVAEMS
jgi:hypothetical protein